MGDEKGREEGEEGSQEGEEGCEESTNEVKKETIKRDDDDTASVVDGVVEARLLDELDGQSVAGGLKRSRDRSDGKKRSKSEKKRAKKTKKAEKKVKKAAKKEKKAAKKARKKE